MTGIEIHDYNSVFGAYRRIIVGDVDVVIVDSAVRVGGTYNVHPNQILDLIEALHTAHDILTDGKP